MSHPSFRFNHRLLETLAFLMVGCGLLLLIALLSYHPEDPGWSRLGPEHGIHNLLGHFGAWWADSLLSLFGLVSLLLPLALILASWCLHHRHHSRVDAGDEETPVDEVETGSLAPLQVNHALGLLMLLPAASALLASHCNNCLISTLHEGNGGMLGHWLADGLIRGFNPSGATLISTLLLLSGLTLFAGISWFALLEWIGHTLHATVMAILRWRPTPRQLSQQHNPSDSNTDAHAEPQQHTTPNAHTPPLQEDPIPVASVKRSPRHGKKRPKLDIPVQADPTLPPLQLLDPPSSEIHVTDPAILTQQSRELETHLANYNIDAKVTGAYPGPVITRFEVLPAPGVKVSRIANIAKDLARSMSALSVRIVEVIPGKSVIGVEVPNLQREMVMLQETLAAPAFQNAKSPLTLALGKDIGGACSIADLARMPHLLVAGTTGSGKSVALNTMIISLLYKAQPSEVRLIMIDPKMLELSVYEDIPHLLAPVVTDMKEAANALRWSVAEMERRYQLMAALGVRNIAGFNQKIIAAEARDEPLMDPLQATRNGNPPIPLTTLPYIVIIVDEFADMMMVVGKKVEQLIARLAQKARAAGIHLVLATQRPSVDVITGLIKANIPARIGFQVSSKIDSRTVLDQTGAEALLGHGDMLYLGSGSSVPTRIHGAFVDDHEVHAVVAHVKAQGAPNYVDEVLETTKLPEQEDAGEGNSGGEQDPLFDQAVRIVTESRRASISGVQRHLKIGYNRAARLVEDMEKAGIVSSMSSNGSREVLAAPPPPR